MLKRAVAVAAMVVVAMIAAKDGRVMRATGLAGSCSVLQSYKDGTEIVTCGSGKLEGRPNLSSRGCRTIGMKSTTQYWRCAPGFDIHGVSR